MDDFVGRRGLIPAERLRHLTERSDWKGAVQTASAALDLWSKGLWDYPPEIPHGAPILDGCTASFDCVLQTSIDAGTHSIFIGAVKALESTGTSPLVYVDGAYSHTCSKS